MNHNSVSLFTVTTLVVLFWFIPDTWSQEEAEDWFMKGNVLSRQGRFQEGEETLQETARYKPSN